MSGSRLGLAGLVRMLAASLGVAGLAGCATQPERIVPAYVSPERYQAWPCIELGAEREQLAGREAELRQQLDLLAANDARQMGVGLLGLWPALIFLEGGDGPDAIRYSRIKAELAMVDRTMARKRCAALPALASPSPAPPVDTGMASPAGMPVMAAGSANADGVDVQERLRELDTLHRAGIISDLDYRTERARLTGDDLHPRPRARPARRGGP